MYIHTSAFTNLLPGEPRPEALHREEFYSAKEPVSEAEVSATVTDHTTRARVTLLRAEVVTGVGKFFA